MTENKSKSNSPKAEAVKTSAELEDDSVIETVEASEEEMTVTTDLEVEMTEDHEETLVIDQKVASTVVKMVISPETVLNVIIKSYSARKPR